MEKQTPELAELHLSTLWEPRRLLVTATRCLLVAVGMAIGIGGLGFLAESQVVSESSITHYQSMDYSINVAIWSVPPMLFITLQVEFQLLFVLSLKRRWALCQILFPVIGAFLGAVLGWILFPQTEHGPKQTMLIAGAALLLFSGVSLQLAFWSMLPEIRADARDFPRSWYTAIVLLSATFFGALHGWTDTHPQLKRLLDYRQKQWMETKHDRLPAPEDTETIIIY